MEKVVPTNGQIIVRENHLGLGISKDAEEFIYDFIDKYLTSSGIDMAKFKKDYLTKTVNLFELLFEPHSDECLDAELQASISELREIASSNTIRTKMKKIYGFVGGLKDVTKKEASDLFKFFLSLVGYVFFISYKAHTKLTNQ